MKSIFQCMMQKCIKFVKITNNCNMDILWEKSKTKRAIIDTFNTIIGAVVMAFGISFFLLPTQLSSGGVSGIGTIAYYLFNIPMGVTIIVLNVPLFLITAYKFGKKFFINSVIGTVALSLFTDFFDKFNPITEDRLLACIYGGLLVGLGTAIVLKADSSTGGVDMLSYLLKEYNSNIKLGNAIVISDAIIVGINVILFKEIEIGLYSAIAIYLCGKMVDIIFEGIYFTKLLFIVSDKTEQIADEVGKKVKRGTTGIYGKGMYTKKDKLILMCAVSRRDVSSVKKIVKKIDSKCFMVVTNSREVLGEGFKMY